MPDIIDLVDDDDEGATLDPDDERDIAKAKQSYVSRRIERETRESRIARTASGQRFLDRMKQVTTPRPLAEDDDL